MMKKKIIDANYLLRYFLCDNEEQNAVATHVIENIEDKEIYLPFIGIVLKNHKKKIVRPLKIAYLTQKALLVILYQNLFKVSVTEMATCLQVSKMSASRCFNEIESLWPDMIDDKGRAGRFFKWSNTRRELWNRVKEHLRNPVIRQFSLDCMPPFNIPQSGMTTVSYYSQIADNRDECWSSRCHRNYPKRHCPLSFRVYREISILTLTDCHSERRRGISNLILRVKHLNLRFSFQLSAFNFLLFFNAFPDQQTNSFAQQTND